MLATSPTSDVSTQLGLLSQMIEDISGELALEPLLVRIIERACKLIGADDGVIGLYVPELDAIRTAASYNIPQEQLRSILPRGKGLTGRVLELDEPVRCRYGDLPYPSRTAAHEMNMIGMPIRAQRGLIGVFGIGVWPPGELNAEAHELLDLFARHAAVAIENARRYAEEQRRAARFALIARMAAVAATGPDVESLLQQAADAIHETLDYPNVDIPLIYPDEPDTLMRGYGCVCSMMVAGCLKPRRQAWACAICVSGLPSKAARCRSFPARRTAHESKSRYRAWS